MEHLAQDLRYTARSFARSPAFFLVSALTLALGIGATTAIFSVVNGVLLQPLEYPSSARIVQLFQVAKNGERNSISEPNFADWRAQNRSFEAMTMVSASSPVTVNGLSEPTRSRAATISRDFFAVFGVRPRLGRAFSDDELRAKAPASVIVSDAFWRKNLGGTAAALGKTIRVDTDVLTVIGVMPPEVDYPAGNELWLPHDPDVSRSRTSGGKRAIARMKDGVTLDQARADMSALSRRLKQQYGDATGMFDAETIGLRDQLVGKVRGTLMLLLGASAFLLLIACANVVNLLVARMMVKRTEIGVRMALGAGRARLARQFLTEAAVLSLVGSVAGVAIAAAAVPLLLAMQTGSIPRAGDVHVSLPVLGFAVLVSAVTAAALGLLTAWHGTRGDIRETLSASERTQAGTGSTSRVRRTLVVAQMALTVVLLVGAGLLGRSFVLLLETDPGFRTRHAVVLDAAIPYENGDDGARRRAAFYAELMARVRSIPGVTTVGAASGFPLLGGGNDGGYVILSRPDEPIRPEDYPVLAKDPRRSGYANFMVVDGNYFSAMNIPLLSGRVFNAGDTPAAASAGVVSASFAKSKWPNESAVGKYIQYGNMDGDMRPYTIVGVVGDVRDENLATAPTPTFYAFEQQRPRAAGVLHVVMQTEGDPSPVMASARAILREVRPDVPPVLRTMETVVAASVADRRFALVLVGVFGGAALLLATLGVYSVISYLVTQRRREIGVRIALGAQRADVLSLVLRQGALLAMTGIGVGAVGALFLTRLLRGFVFGISTTDPLAYGGVIVLLSCVALLASWLPARRAARVDPMRVLRE